MPIEKAKAFEGPASGSIQAPFLTLCRVKPSKTWGFLKNVPSPRTSSPCAGFSMQPPVQRQNAHTSPASLLPEHVKWTAWKPSTPCTQWPALSQGLTQPRLARHLEQPRFQRPSTRPHWPAITRQSARARHSRPYCNGTCKKNNAKTP